MLHLLKNSRGSIVRTNSRLEDIYYVVQEQIRKCSPAKGLMLAAIARQLLPEQGIANKVRASFTQKATLPGCLSHHKLKNLCTSLRLCGESSCSIV
jgi:hypothetical protein